MQPASLSALLGILAVGVLGSSTHGTRPGALRPRTSITPVVCPYYQCPLAQSSDPGSTPLGFQTALYPDSAGSTTFSVYCDYGDVTCSYSGDLGTAGTTTEAGCPSLVCGATDYCSSYTCPDDIDGGYQQAPETYGDIIQCTYNNAGGGEDGTQCFYYVETGLLKSGGWPTCPQQGACTGSQRRAARIRSSNPPPERDVVEQSRRIRTANAEAVWMDGTSPW